MTIEQQLTKWRKDPVVFVQDVLVNPETGEPFDLYRDQKIFVREGFTLVNGRLPYPELLYMAIKKSGKSTLAAMCLLYVIIVLAGRYGEGFCCANDLEQSQSRVFRAAARIVEASPRIRGSAQVYINRIEFPATGSTIHAIASDFRGAAGANPNITVFDELWGYTSESAHRLWDEMVPPPTRKVACRLTVSYAGFMGESELLEKLWERGLKGERMAA